MDFEAFMAPIAQHTVRYSYSCTYALANEVCIYMGCTQERGGLGLSHRWSSTSSVH